jgi:hypothetical protein
LALKEHPSLSNLFFKFIFSISIHLVEVLGS